MGMGNIINSISTIKCGPKSKDVCDKYPGMKFEVFTLESPRLRRVTAMKSKNGTNDHFFRVFPSNKKKCCISNLILIY